MTLTADTNERTQSHLQTEYYPLPQTAKDSVDPVILPASRISLTYHHTKSSIQLHLTSTSLNLNKVARALLQDQASASAFQAEGSAWALGWGLVSGSGFRLRESE